MQSLSPTDRAKVLQDATSHFWTHVTPIVKIALTIHVVLFGLFFLLDESVLLVGNGFSVLAYIVCLHALSHSRFTMAGLIFSIEVISHAALATWRLGWESNFYFYLFCIVPIVAFSLQQRPWARWFFSLTILLVAAVGFMWRHQTGTHSQIDPQLLEVIAVINIIGAIALLLHSTALSVRFALSMQLKLFHAANRDSLTDLYTRRRILDHLNQLGSKDDALALVLLDVDHFKAINDRYGHERGDIVLQRIAAAISANVRATDLAARWGGEEFLILMPSARLPDARALAERVMARTRDWVGELPEGSLKITATLAITEFKQCETFSDALERADLALYRGKAGGRDQIVIAE
ncbi:GGDEF domain-containing protein [Pseudomonas sp. Marseille-QA0892]